MPGEKGSERCVFEFLGADGKISFNMLALPFVTFEKWSFLGKTGHFFGLMGGLGVFVNYFVTTFRGSQLQLQPKPLQRLCFCLVGFGYSSAYLINLIFYGEKGVSSVGAMLGCVLGYWVWRLLTKTPKPAAYFDCVWFGVPFGLALGRVGCTFVHDHKGIPTEFFLGVAYPEGVRHNLGLYEAFYLILVAGVFLYTARCSSKRPTAEPYYYFKLFFLFYAPFRFLIYFLR